MLLKQLLLTLTALAICHCGMALNPKQTALFPQQYITTHYKGSDGLQNTMIKTTVQDTLGFIWFATDNGLIKYNGIEFTHYTNKIPSQYVKWLLLKSDGNLLASTDKGIVEINSKIDTAFFNVILPGSSTITDSTLYYPKQLFEDSEGTIWIADAISVWSYKNKKATRYFFDKKNNCNSFNRSFSFAENENNELITFSQQGYAYYFNRAKNSFLPFGNLTKLPNVNGVLFANKNKLYVATEEGMYQIEIDQHFKVLSKTKLINQKGFSHLIKTQQNKVIASTWNKGIFIIKNEQANQKQTTISDFENIKVNQLFQDNSDNLWISSDIGSFLLQSSFMYSPINGIPNVYIHDIDETDQGEINVIAYSNMYGVTINNNTLSTQLLYTNKEKNNLLIGVPSNNGYYCSNSSSKVFQVNKPYPLQQGKAIQLNRNAFCMCIDKSDNLWVCEEEAPYISMITNDFSRKQYGAEKGIKSNILVVICDEFNNVYCGGNSDSTYLYVYDKKLDSFVNLSIALNLTDSKNFAVNAITTNALNEIYLGTTHGLFLYKNKSITPIDFCDTKQVAIRALAFDRDKHLWIGTSQGIYKYTSNYVIRFDEKQGLITNSVNYRTLLIDKFNRLWIGTPGGLVGANINAPIVTKKPYFTTILFDDKKASTITSIKRGMYLNLKYNALSFPANNIQYQTRILEQDTAWSEKKSNNDLFLPKLKLGTYTIQVRARQGGNFLWSEPVSYAFKVEPHWYEKWWALLLYLISFSLIIWSFVKLNTIRLLREKDKLELIVKERTYEVTTKKEEIQEHLESIHNQKEKIEEAYKNVKMLSEIGKDITAHLSIEEISKRIYQNINTLMDAHVFSVGVYNEKNNALDFPAAIENNANLPFISFPIDKSIPASYCFCEDQKLVFHSKSAISQAFPEAEKKELRKETASFIYLPLKVKDKRIGVITVQSHVENAYTQQHINLLKNLAVYIAIALDNAESYKQINFQKELISKSHEEIKSSIVYAQKIQEAILPPVNHLKAIFPDNFIMYKPRDIVSGDFYWTIAIKQYQILLAADCTGHGVPGAFVSMMGVSFLNEIIQNEKVWQSKNMASLMLDLLRDKVKHALHQNGNFADNKDGMDLALCLIDSDTKTLQYAGANNPICIIRNNTFPSIEIEGTKTEKNSDYTLYQIKPDSMPIGYYINEKPFTNKSIPLQPGDKLYMFSDGYIDQFGGKYGKKIMIKNFRNLLLKNHLLPMQEQKAHLNKTLTQWMGNNYEQVDDILIIGVTLN